MTIEQAKFIPLVPLVSMVVCALLGCGRGTRKWAALVTIAALTGAFVMVCTLVPAISTDAGSALAADALAAKVSHGFEWISAGGFSVQANFFVDSLTMVMLLMITFIGTLIAIYASGYMSGDPGYARFFAYVSLFIFSMLCIVMGGNLLVLYLGWEGVGLASYLLIGFYYQKPSAVAAAKKAFIVNRIGDLGFALGIMLTYYEFGTIEYAALFQKIGALGSMETQMGGAVWLIPFLLMLGAFGKSAQLPLYVWLPDAMEGPTPVSALIHAATMVTSGIYMISRLLPLFELSPYALPTVAVVGCATALFGATIAITQRDIKRVWAFSTVSQLGYMFLGVGVGSTQAGVFHLVSHAFFKALLFLTAGSVMHALTGQLDLHRMSGLRRKMPVTAVLMLCGALALAGFPLTSGFFSKDAIIAEAFIFHPLLGVLGLVTAFFTAIYAFRLWCRVFMGPLKYEMGTDHHHDDAGHGHGDDHHGGSGHGGGHGKIEVVHSHEPHEMPWLMNGPLVLLAIGALGWGFIGKSLIPHLIAASTATTGGHEGTGHEHLLWGMDVHVAMEIISSVVGLTGIGIAVYLHWINRAAGDRLAGAYPKLVSFLYHKYYVDEVYDLLVVGPLRTLGRIFFWIDQVIIDGLIGVVGWVPRALGLMAQAPQQGILQGYGLGMAGGLVLLLVIILWAM